MISKAIVVENLSKAYQLGDFGTGTISRDLERYWARLRGKEDPFLKIGESNDRTTKGSSDIVWSLKDLNFIIERGQAVGIIGPNGAGKSTLLKILSRVTSPTTGNVRIRGRVASLLEVGTGFHPELTGRENIFLNGAILGMRRHEIKKKFDEMVDFAAVERYVDTPVKRYSTGMYVRLAFAVAAHLESEILIVDEVLAVGDAEFQKKCLGKMNTISKGEGRTILFVSHNMASIQALCSQTITITKGEISFQGGTQEGVGRYYQLIKENNRAELIRRKSGSPSEVADFMFTSVNTLSPLATGQEAIFEVTLNAKDNYKAVSVGLVVRDENQQIVTTFFTRHSSDAFHARKGTNRFVCKIPKLALIPGTYSFSLWSAKEGVITSDYLENALEFTVEQGDFYGNGFIPNMNAHGSICVENLWSII